MKKILSLLFVSLFLVGTLFVFAKNDNPKAPKGSDDRTGSSLTGEFTGKRSSGKNFTPEQIVCLKAATTTRESAIKTAISTYQTAVLTAFDTRSAAFLAARDLGSRQTIKNAMKKARVDYKATIKVAKKTRDTARKAARGVFKTDVKACKAQVNDIEVVNQGNDRIE